MIKSIQVTITGKVQNVGFRYYTRRIANELDIYGFVKNQINGSVYIEAEGDEKKLAEFLVWCHKGPAWAEVETVDSQEQPLQHFEDFLVR